MKGNKKLNTEKNCRRIILANLNMLILQLGKKRPFCSKDITIFLYEKFGCLISNGSTDPVLKSLHKDGFLSRKEYAYSLTKKGNEERKNLIKNYSELSKEINTLLKIDRKEELIWRGESSTSLHKTKSCKTRTGKIKQNTEKLKMEV